MSSIKGFIIVTVILSNDYFSVVQVMHIFASEKRWREIMLPRDGINYVIRNFVVRR